MNSEVLDLYLVKAKSFYYLSQFENAIEAYKAAISINPDFSQLYFWLGLIYCKMHNFEQASVEFKNFITHNNSDSYTYTTEAKCLYSDDMDVEYCMMPNSYEMANFDLYLSKGYMRYANYYRLKICPNCGDCLPFRVLLNDFKMSGSQKKLFKKNSDIELKILPETMIDEERFSLFKKYRLIKHKEDTAHDFEYEFGCRHYGFSGTIEMDYYLNRKLIAVGIVDLGIDSVYSSYFYYDTDYSDRRLGIYSMLREIDLFKGEKKYYYPGWLVEKVSNMAYKREFRPNQVLVGNSWEDYLS